MNINRIESGVCPECGSEDWLELPREEWIKFRMGGVTVLRQTYRCLTCKAEWLGNKSIVFDGKTLVAAIDPDCREPYQEYYGEGGNKQ